MAEVPPVSAPPVPQVDALVSQALRLLRDAHQAAQRTCVGYNVEVLDEAAAACAQWLTSRGERVW